MVFIYALIDSGLVIYVGSTVNMLRRKQAHKRKSKIPQGFNWTMKELEMCVDSDRYKREQHWINTLNPLYNELKAYNIDTDTLFKKICREGTLEQYNEYMRLNHPKHHRCRS